VLANVAKILENKSKFVLRIARHRFEQVALVVDKVEPNQKLREDGHGQNFWHERILKVIGVLEKGLSVEGDPRKSKGFGANKN